MLEANSIFNESLYITLNPDVAEAKLKGLFNSGFDHFTQFGKFENRSPSAYFDQSFYLAKNWDVAKAVEAGIISSGFDHFRQFGQKENRDTSIVFQNSYYLAHQPDVAAAVERDELTGIEHFVTFGIDEGRTSSPAFDVRYYLEHHPDLQAAGFGYREAIEHFFIYGLQEGRASSPTFDVRYYLGHYPDLQAVGFNYQQAFQHFLIYGLKEGRLGYQPLPYGQDGLVVPDVVTGNPGFINPSSSFSQNEQQETTFTTGANSNNEASQPDSTDTLPLTITTPTDEQDNLLIPSDDSNDSSTKLTPTVMLPKTLMGLEKEPTTLPLDLPPNAGGANSKKNPAPKHLQFSTTQEEYYKNTSVRLKDAWVFDASGASDLDKVEFSLHKIGDSKEDIQTATKFNIYSKDERWGWFNYSMRDLTPGKYQLKGVAYDKDGGKSNTAVTHFTVSNQELPMPLIGVIDTGFSANNPDLDYSRVTLGKDLVDGDNNPLLQAGEGNEHGTHILGIIAATQNNGVGIYGMNDEAPLWLGRAIGSGKWAESLMEFVDAAKASGQPKALVNLSLDMTQVNPDGSVTTRYEFTPKERQALEYARQNGVLIVAAAGNDGDVMSVLGQASQEFDNIITVGAANGNQRADYSSFGYGLDIVTEGGTIANPILSTVGDDVGTMAGTSVAAAQVTGAASLVWEANPGLNYRQVIEVLKSNATDLNTVGWDKETGAGFLNVDKAVEAAKAIAPVTYAPEAFLTPTTWGGEGKVTAMERAAWDIVSETFTGIVGPDIGVNLRNSTNFGDRSSENIAYGETLTFDAWTYGEVGTDIWLNTPDALWYHVQGTNYWVPSAYINGYPPSRPPVLPPEGSDPTTGSDPITGGGTTPTDPSAGNNYEWELYTVQSGDTLSAIAQSRTGNASDYLLIVNYPSNNIPNPDLIYPGDQIWVPKAGAVPPIGSDPNTGFDPNTGSNPVPKVSDLFSDTYSNNSWLGDPISELIDQGNGVSIQKFENGYIIWNGSEANAYDYTPDNSITEVPKNEPTVTKTFSKNVYFVLQDQSLWGWGQVNNQSLNVYGKPSLKTSIGIGEISGGFEYKLEAFLSGGTFDVDFPALFDISYVNAAQAGSSAAINFKSKLASQGSLKTEIGGSLVGAANIFLKFDSTSIVPSLGIEIGGKLDFNEAVLKDALKSPVVVDIGLGANTSEIKDNTLKAEDKAFQYIDVPNALAWAASIAAGSTGVGAALIPYIQSTTAAMDKAGIGAKLGANVKQESIFEIKGFEIDFDGQVNGNELDLGVNDSGELNINIPSNYSIGEIYKFTPTVRPIVDFSTQFSMAGQAEATFDLKKVLPLPSWLNNTEFKASGETPYTPPLSFTNKFNPFSVANYYAKLPEINLKIV